jgi:5-formyltetrahydrofolate cyclo-ligase
MSQPDSPTGGVLAGAALRDAKMALRRHVLALRDAMPGAEHAVASAAIATRISSLASYASARVVLLTLAFRSEWDTRPLVADALAGGRTVALPRVDALARMLTLHAVADIARDAAPGYQGIPEPLPHCPRVAPADVEWVLVPGVAFDADGRRLGYGGGYYDRLLPSLRASAARVAGAFDLQIVERVPAAPHDLGVDVVATESRILEGRARDHAQQ